MTKKEWLEIGYDKHIIDLEEYEEIPFHVMFRQWFCMKMKLCSGNTMDRIEVTYNKYLIQDKLDNMNISQITENDIIDFLTACILKYPKMNLKEFKRILQVVNNPLVYAKDLHVGGASLYDWDSIKRRVPMDKLDIDLKREYAVSVPNVEKILDLVINHNIYPVKRCQCLLLCMNFYLGLRIGELAALTFNDFDFEKNVVKITKTESKFYNRDESGARVGALVYRVSDTCKTIYSVREIPILPEVRVLYDLIKEIHRNRNYESDLLGYDGTDCIMVQSLARTLRILCLKCDIDYFDSHTIRKTFATMLHFSGVPTRTISDLLGHSEIGTTENCYILSYKEQYNETYKYMHKALNYKVS